VGVEGNPVDDRGDQAGAGEHGAPFSEREVGSDRDRGSFLPLGTVRSGPKYAAGRAKEPGPVSPATPVAFWSAVIMHHRAHGHGLTVIMHGRHMRRRGGRGGAGKRRSGHAERYEDRKDGSCGPAVAACRAPLDAHRVLQGDSWGAALRAPGARGLICWPLWELLPIETVCGITLKALFCPATIALACPGDSPANAI